jgi:hypothetical protein
MGVGMTGTAEGRFVPTNAIKRGVAGRETEVLDALGVDWRSGRPHIPCPYRDHADDNASWRWDGRKGKAFCTCNKAASIFDVVAKVAGGDFEAAKIRVAELLKRDDLIRYNGDKWRPPLVSRDGCGQPIERARRSLRQRLTGRVPWLPPRRGVGRGADPEHTHDRPEGARLL